MDPPAVSVSGLRKAYGEKVAVDGIDLEVAAGEVFGLLGPNGAGKTTTFECLEGLRTRDAGSVELCGLDPDRSARRLAEVIGVQLQSSALPATMTPREALEFFSAYHHRPADLGLLERMGLSSHASTKYDELSGGLQRRLSLALAVAHEPQVVFLDEPTSGLDVGSRAELHRLIRELSSRGTTVLLATHDMAEAEQLADRVAILLNGVIVALGTPREITATGAGYTKVLVRTEPSNLLDTLDVPAARRVETEDDYTTFFTSNATLSVATILSAVEGNESTLVDLRVERPSLEERFLELTGAGT